MAGSTIDGNEVPQANSIIRLHRLAVLLLAHQMALIAAEFANKRDRAFYFHAARLLGFVDETENLSSRGRQLAILEGADVYRSLADGFVRSKVGSCWIQWAGVDDVRRLDPAGAGRFLAAHTRLAGKTQVRRASTLSAWVQALCLGLPALAVTARPRTAGRPQLAFTDLEPGRTFDTQVRWPPAARFPHNEGGARVREILEPDLADSKILLVSGYSALDHLIELLAGRVGGEPVRLLLGTEPFPSRTARFRSRPELGREIRDYWLSRGVSVLLSGAIVHVRNQVVAGTVKVRTARSSRPIHAKIYLSDTAVTLGSSNFTAPGLSRQSEANARFPKREAGRYGEAKLLAEGLWSQGVEYDEEFIALLDALLRSVSWQEALARACASILEGDWAKRYVPAALLENVSPRIWRHQLQGISQGMWVLENVGSVLVADATGSGKTRMGAWLIRGAFDRQYRLGFVQRPNPLILAPPQVATNWEDALRETGLNFQVESHGPLSSTRASRHQALVQLVGDTELLAVDEAHNFVNRSDRTTRLVTHYAENVILFTATPINRGAGDLLALVELLGADNLSDDALAVLATLRRGPGPTQDPLPDVELIRQEIRRFTVRRTRAQLNEIADAHPDEYRIDGRQARYPRHVARYVPISSTQSDESIAREISSLADQLSGVTRLGAVLRVVPGLSEASYLHRVVASARALARHYVMSCLRSSRAALVEHALGTQVAVEQHLVDGRWHHLKKATGDMSGRSTAAAPRPPRWELEGEPLPEHRWLRDADLHAERAHEDARLYRTIGELAQSLSSTRENAKVDHLAALLERHGLVIGFDSHVISLWVFEQALRTRLLPVECLTGEGGATAKRRAVAQLGLAATTTRLIALCTDAFSEGLNLQKASCVMHLDTPTVIRLAEQRAGRVDRMDSPHQEVAIWWPKDSPAFAPLRRDVLRQRHHMVQELIGANLSMPDEPEASTPELTAEELAHRADVEADSAELDPLQYADAFRAVRDLVSGPRALVSRQVYEHLRTSQAEVVACVSLLKSQQPWGFFSIGGLERAAPRWVFLEGFEATPELDLTRVTTALRSRLTDGTETRSGDARSDFVITALVTRLRDCEHALLPVRRRRALNLLDAVSQRWVDQARAAQNHRWHSELRELREWLCLQPVDRRAPFPDPGSVADGWLRLLRPRVRRAFEERRNRRRPFRLEDLLPELVADPIPLDRIWRAFDGVQSLLPVDQRILALIVGVDG